MNYISNTVSACHYLIEKYAREAENEPVRSVDISKTKGVQIDQSKPKRKRPTAYNKTAKRFKLGKTWYYESQARRWKQAYDLRQKGWEYDEIANEIGMTTSCARRYTSQYNRYLKSNQ